MSTLALSRSRRLGERGTFGMAFRYGDLVLLAVALPVFIVAGWPLLGYGVATPDAGDDSGPAGKPCAVTLRLTAAARDDQEGTEAVGGG